MVSNVELATSMIQLTGVLLPIMVVVTRYYLQNRTRWAFGETREDLEAVLFINLLYSLVVWAYVFSAIVIINETSLLLSLTVISYGLFLYLLLFATLGWTGLLVFSLTGAAVVYIYWALNGFSL